MNISIAPILKKTLLGSLIIFLSACSSPNETSKETTQSTEPNAKSTSEGNSAICYNCPPEWANWKGVLAAIKEDIDLDIPMDNKNSGQTLSQLIAEKSNPVADVAYYGISYGLNATKKGVVEPYKPANWDRIPDELKDPNGNWFAIHSGSIGFFVNTEALNGLPVPRSWDDLLNPQYKGMVGFLDPTSAFVGYASAVAINEAKGGSFDDFTPSIDYFNKLIENDPIVPKQTSYARVVSGEIPILLDYDFNAYRAKYDDKAPVEFVIPQEGSISIPYVVSKVKNSPHPENADKILDYLVSDKGQALWAKAYLRPVLSEAVDDEAKAKFLPDSEYARIKAIDYAKMAQVQESFTERYLNEVN